MASVVIQFDGDEYRVPGPANNEAQAYYTDDKQDAIGTARIAFGDKTLNPTIRRVSEFKNTRFQNGCDTAHEEIGNKLEEAGIENQQHEYMTLGGKQYTKYGKTWMLGGKAITNPALLQDLEQEYVRQFKST